VDGVQPLAGLVRDTAGNLFGTTESGGPSFGGTVFKLDASGEEVVLHSFGLGTEGALPMSGLIRKAGGLYGTTQDGGVLNCFTGDVFGCGTVFKLGPP
jgi:uncharacterized repeat protein (TIGR03803 family)